VDDVFKFMGSTTITPIIRDGPWVEHYQNGALKKVESYDEGKLHGLQQIFHKNSVLKQEVTYENGRKVGAFEKWYTDGKAEILSHYENGRLVGESINYDRKGSVMVRVA
jgi:antitoxin component YwqK of YwqJK toxin-antitoxin module